MFSSLSLVGTLVQRQLPSQRVGCKGMGQTNRKWGGTRCAMLYQKQMPVPDWVMRSGSGADGRAAEAKLKLKSGISAVIPTNSLHPSVLQFCSRKANMEFRSSCSHFLIPPNFATDSVRHTPLWNPALLSYLSAQRCLPGGISEYTPLQ